MNKVAIVTDSTCDLTKEIIEKYNIYTLPLYVIFKENSFKDGVDIDTKKLFEKVDKTGMLPKTSASTPGDFYNLFKKLLDEGYDIIYAGIGGNFSASLQNANIAKGELSEDRIHLVDSENLSTGIGILILKACQMRDQGMSASQIARAMKEIAPKIRTAFVVETLEYIHKGGRCSGTARLFGTMLGIRPLIQVVNGNMEAKKIIGPMRRGLDKMVCVYKKDYEAGLVDEDFFFITSMDDRYTNSVSEKVKPIVNAKNIINTYAGCVIGSHCGPGCIGIIYAVK